jgi:hypothetical protein
MTLQQFSKQFNTTKLWDETFNNELGGYVMDNILITPVDENRQPVIYNGSLEQKMVQSLQKVEGYIYKIIK